MMITLAWAGWTQHFNTFAARRVPGTKKLLASFALLTQHAASQSVAACLK
jgi:hypothetical protein